MFPPETLAEETYGPKGVEICLLKMSEFSDLFLLHIKARGSIHSSLAAMGAFINKNKTPQPIAKGFLIIVRWLPV